MPPDRFSQSSLDLAATAPDSSPSHADTDASTPPPSGWSAASLRPRLLLLVLAGIVWIALAQWLVSQPRLPIRLGANAQGELVLRSAYDTALQAQVGKRITSIRSETGVLDGPDTLLMRRSMRWLASDMQRSSLIEQHKQLMQIVGSGSVTLEFSDGHRADVRTAQIKLAELTPGFWLRAVVSTLLALTALGWRLATAPQIRKSLALLTLCQAVLVAVDAVGEGLGTAVPPGYLTLDLALRTVAELTMFGTIVQASGVHMTSAPWSRRGRTLAWLALGLSALLLGLRVLPQAWWWTQAGVQLALAAATLTQYRSQQQRPHPWTNLLSHFTLPALLIWPLVTLAQIGGFDVPNEAQDMREMAPHLWSAALSALFLALPLMMRSQRAAREIVLWSALSLGCLAGALFWTALRAAMPWSALWLDLLGVLVLGGVARWWLSHHVFERPPMRETQLFDALYRAIRLVDSQPLKAQSALRALLSSIFAPLKVEPLERQLSRSVILADGACLLIPFPVLHPSGAGPGLRNSSLMLHGSQSGRRLFTPDDAHLADLIVEQIQRAVQFEKAVEQGRNEERTRLAHDLHDDIGARLLTLMYKASTPEMEDYVRHTLKDLKTLTRGLSASDRNLSGACAEWKTDMAQRLAEVDCDLQWSASWDQDQELSVVHWSAVTRILRELVSNAIAHAHASNVRIELNLEMEQLVLRVQDNGNGKSPELWAHGLGLSGVRKRVKQLDGSVQWKSVQDAGILCEVRITLRKPSDLRWS